MQPQEKGKPQMQQVLPALATLAVLVACIYWMVKSYRKSQARGEQKGPYSL